MTLVNNLIFHESKQLNSILLAHLIFFSTHQYKILKANKQAELINTLQAVFEDCFAVKKTSIKELTANKLKQRLDKYFL